MEKQQTQHIQHIDIEVLREKIDNVSYADEDIVIAKHLHEMLPLDEMYRLDCLVIFYCLEGRMQFDMGNERYLVESHSVIFGLPGFTINHTLISPNCKMRIICFSNGFLQRTIRIEKQIWKTFSYIYRNPVKEIDRRSMLHERLESYKEIILSEINNEPRPYRKEIIQHLCAALLCEVFSLARQRAERQVIKEESKLSQSDHTLAAFLEKLTEDNGHHRSVSYFAEQLCYTPKYLSKVIKQASGKNALEFINAHAIEHIKFQLIHSDKSIKEIADEFNFPNLSFFGKFVKAHLGMSPTLYRTTMRKA